MIAFLHVLLFPLRTLYNRFTELRRRSERRLAITGQAISLIEALRQRYRLHEGVIYITEPTEQQCYLFLKEEGQLSSTGYLTREQRPAFNVRYKEEGGTEPDFTLHLPDFLASEEPEIRRFLDQYKPAGKRYALNIYPYA